MNRLIVWLSVFLGFGVPAYSATVGGFVYDSVGKPVADVEIAFKETILKKSCRTDSGGRFDCSLVEGIKPGDRISFIVSKPGYRTYTKQTAYLEGNPEDFHLDKVDTGRNASSKKAGSCSVVVKGDNNTVGSINCNPSHAQSRKTDIDPPNYAYLDVSFRELPAFYGPLSLFLVKTRLKKLGDDVARILNTENVRLWRRTTPGTYANVDSSTVIPLARLPGDESIPSEFGISAGDYRIELGAGPSAAEEHLSIFYRNGKWTRSIEVTVKGRDVFATPPLPDQPDISLTVVNTGHLGVVLRNTSDLVLKDPYYRVVLWSLKKPDASHPMEWIRSFSGNSIMRRGSIRSDDLMKDDAPRNGEEMYGYAIVSCPDCIRLKTYTVAFEIGGKGWYCEMEPGATPWRAGKFAEDFLKYWPSVNSIPRGIDEHRFPIDDLDRY